MTEWEVHMAKYLAQGQDVQTEYSENRASWISIISIIMVKIAA